MKVFIEIIIKLLLYSIQHMLLSIILEPFTSHNLRKQPLRGSTRKTVTQGIKKILKFTY